MQTCEYWFDYGFGSRVSEIMDNGDLRRSFDVSAMTTGVHSITLRFRDDQGLWTAPVAKHFVIPAQPLEMHDDNKIYGIEYWIDYDYDYDSRKYQTAYGGCVAMTLDITGLNPGVHSVAYRVRDTRGLSAATFLKHFVVPSEAPAMARGISIYEYWFNDGPHTRVDVDMQNPLIISNMVIEVKDVVPNAITEAYRFDVADEKVIQPDDVTFGIQVFDVLGELSV